MQRLWFGFLLVLAVLAVYAYMRTSGSASKGGSADDGSNGGSDVGSVLVTYDDGTELTLSTKKYTDKVGNKYDIVPAWDVYKHKANSFTTSPPMVGYGYHSPGWDGMIVQQLPSGIYPLGSQGQIGSLVFSQPPIAASKPATVELQPFTYGNHSAKNYRGEAATFPLQEEPALTYMGHHVYSADMAAVVSAGITNYDSSLPVLGNQISMEGHMSAFGYQFYQPEATGGVTGRPGKLLFGLVMCDAEKCWVV